MGIIASSLSRRDAAVKPIPRRDRGTTEEYEVMFFEEERLGPAALEARGDRFMSIGRHRRGWSPDISRLFEEAATSYVLAEKWRKAAQAFSEQARYDLQFGDEGELSAASALLRCAKCYNQIEEKEAGEIAATKHALEKAIALFVKKNNLHLAATSCVDLAEFYTEHQQLHNALYSYEQAADYYGANRRRNRHCRFKANLLRFTLANQEMLRVKGLVHIKDYKRRSGIYIKSSDPDWRARVRSLFDSTSIVQPWM
ncbi:hypothetical protein PAHAL_1G335600 [Panicum hallii]|uniref:Alpha-soluble NSF attachment protein n=1 Tax=Panicum hallii TaxID=206008 RepID=A0A2S3GRT6_9POAL|nr:hypothetical protein PAHAL_1G335600 [Panicum hallii]